MIQRTQRKAWIVGILLLVVWATCFAAASVFSYTAFAEDEDVLEVRSSSDFAALVERSDAPTRDAFSGKTIQLYADVEAPDGKGFGAFAGTFRGNGFSISGLRSPLFTSLRTGASVRDLTLIDVDVSGSDVGVIASANGNGATISGVTLYGSVTDGCVVGRNNGTVENVCSYLSVTGGSAFVSRNMANGSVTSCFVYSSFRPTGTDPGLLARESVDGSTMTDCVFYGDVTVDGTTALSLYPFGSAPGVAFHDGLSATFTYVATDGAALTVYSDTGATNTYCKNVTDDTIELFDAEGTYFTTEDYTALSDRFYIRADAYPVNKSLFGHAGTSSDPVEITGADDFNKLNFLLSLSSSGSGFYAVVKQDVFMGQTPVTNKTPVCGALVGNVTTDGCVIVGEDPFAQLTTLYAAVPVEPTFGGDGYEAGPFTAVAAEEVDGAGTKADPYIVTNAGTLAGLLSDAGKNVAGKYAVVTRDILLNKQGNGNNILSDSPLPVRLDLYGAGKTLCNFPSAPFGEVSGKAEGFALILSAYESLSYGVCASVSASGVLADVDVAQRTTQSVTTGFTNANAGTIERCFNGIEGTTYAFAAENTGAITNCSSVASSAFADDLTGVDLCVKTGSRYVNGASFAGSDYYSLEEDGFDVEGTFGYETGKTEAYPTIRREGKTYRVRVTDLNDPAEVGYDDLVFTPDGYDAQEIEEAVTFAVEATVTTRWEYEGAAYEGRELLHAGEYVLYVSVEGDDYVSHVFTYPVIVAQATFEAGIAFETFGNVSVGYTGADVVLRPDPTNLADLTAAGFTLEYEERIAGTTVLSPVRTSGRYTQTLTARSNDYLTLVRTRVITVTRQTLAVSFNETLTTVYGSEPDFLTKGKTILSVSGTVGEDVGKSLYDLVTEEEGEYYAYFATDYPTNGDVGEYATEYTLQNTTNYVLSVTKGVLRVEQAPMTGYAFPDGTYTYDGTIKSVEITDVPAGATIVYDNNEQTNAGTYDVTATVTHKNYLTLEAHATLYVRKKTITLTVSDLTREYGYTFVATDFSFTPSGMGEGENFTDVAQGVTFTPATEETGVFAVGRHEVGLTRDGEAQNYAFVVEKGTLTIEKTSLYALFARASYANVTVEYTGEPQSVAFPEGAFGEVDVETAFVVTGGELTEGEIVDVGTYYVSATVTPVGAGAESYLSATYTKRVVVTLIRPVVTFAQTSFTFTFDGTNFALDEANFPFTTEKIPEGGRVELTFAVRNGGDTEELIHVGRYVVIAEYVGDGNYADARATANVAIQPRVAFLTVAGEYVYSGSNLTPAVEFSYEGGFAGTLTLSDVAFRYVGENTYGQELALVADAGTYEVYADSVNADYTIRTLIAGGYEGVPQIIIEPCPVSLALPALTFEYGTVVEVKSGDYTYTVEDNAVTLLGYPVAATGRTTDVRFRLQTQDVPETNGRRYFPVGRYSVTTDLIYQTTNYRFTATVPQTVIVTPRTLRVTWTYAGEEIKGFTFATPYVGMDQKNRLLCVLDNFAAGEDESVVATTISVMRGASERELRNVGEYQAYVRLDGAAHYVLDADTTMLSVTVTKAALTSVMVNNGTVMQYERINPSFIVDGLRGEDVGRTPNALAGFSFTMLTNYNPASATPGEVYRVSGTFTFDNYVVPAERVQSGTYTVVQGYRQYTMGDARFVYDGTNKTVLIEGVEEGVTVLYGSNNVQKNVGTYTLTATVRYPSGRTASLSCRMTIEKGTPVVTCPVTYDVFRGEYELTDENMGATATLNAIIPDVPGKYVVNGSNRVRSGQNVFSVRFDPTDSRNLNSVTFTKTMTLYVVNGTDLTYNHYDFVVDNDGNVTLHEPLEITLDTANYPEIAEGLELTQNAIPVRRAVLQRTGKEVIEIRYREETIYTLALNVTFSIEEEKKPQSVTVDENLLTTTGLTFAADGVTIYLQSGKGTISLARDYYDEYALYINGEIVSGVYELTSEKKSVNVIITNKSLGVSMYNKTFNVQMGQDSSGKTETDGEEESGFKTYYYYIIGGVGGALLLAVVLIVLLRRR